MSINVTVQDFANELKRPVAELLVQFSEAGVSVTDAQSSISPENKVALLAYLRQIVINEVRSEWRRQVRLGEQSVANESWAADDDPVFNAALSHERDRTWVNALSRLSGYQRAHLSLRVEHGMSFAEIAREIGSSTDAARMVVARATRVLNAQIAAA